MTATASPTATAHETFESCAVFYDELTAHHNYAGLTDTLEELISAHGHPGRRVLDLACGTGKSGLEFAARGYTVTGCDISAAMLARARSKSADVEFLEADIRAVPALGEYDLVTCIDEPVNYLLEPEEVAGAFASAARNLRPGGLLVFDVNTLHTFRTIFARDECLEQEGWFFAWRGRGSADDEEGCVSGFAIEAFRESEPGCWQRLTNEHRERHYPPALIVELLDGAGFACESVHGMTLDGRLHSPADEHAHTKFFYVARNRNRSEGR